MIYFVFEFYFQNALKERIENGVKQCPQSLFIFDEIDKTLPGVLDIVTPYIDYLDHLDGIDYRYAIFIFLRWGHMKTILFYFFIHFLLAFLFYHRY